MNDELDVSYSEAKYVDILLLEPFFTISELPGILFVHLIEYIVSDRYLSNYCLVLGASADLSE